MDKPTVFISYSHQDEEWKDLLVTQLRALELLGHIVIWDDRKIDAGEQWYPEIQAAMQRADIALCLISPSYLASKFCVNEEVPFLLRRREQEDVLLIPILVEPCLWELHEWISPTQMLPRDGKCLSPDFEGKENVVLAEVARTVYRRKVEPASKPTPPAPAWSPPEKLDIARLPVTGSELFGRQKDLALLDDAWDGAAVNVLSFVAWGGVGKSTLVNKWLERLAKDNYRGARRVYAWSFYSQGTSERATSADQFINAALNWFGDPDPTAGSPWDKGERLAKLVRQERTLLVLDGMEPLQSAQAYERGKIKDPALSTLVEELARENPGLCLITTREQISDLDEDKFRVPPSGGNLTDEDSRLKAGLKTRVQQIDLELLSPEAGRALLRIGGVRGTDEELEKATEDFGCHALALNLLAVYLHDILGHHISAAAKIPDLDVPEAEGKHPRRLIAAFEQKFGEGPEVNVLRLLGLFDRPADGASIAALREAPAISGLTDHIQASAEAAWLRALQRLRKHKLIAEESHHAPAELDAHPLVREHFGEFLQRAHPEAWKVGNLRMYQHLTHTTKEFPDTIEEMMPLFAAVTHGCAAGRQQEAYDEVYWRRINRGDEYFSTKKLGAQGAELAALSGFFVTPWNAPSDALTEEGQAEVLNEAGFDLRSLGRLQEAVQPFQASLDICIAQADWKEAAIRATNFSEVSLMLGELPQALAAARQSVELADRSGQWDQQMKRRTVLADALHQAGHLSEAATEFRAAEVLQEENTPQNPLLYSVSGFVYCDLLLSQGQFQEVQTRTAQTLEWGKHFYPLLSIALDQLSLGRAWLLQATTPAPFTDGVNVLSAISHPALLTQPMPLPEQNATALAQAADWLHRAVDGLRKAGTQHHLPRGLLARAAWARVAGQSDRAARDLAEAFTIATRGEMRLHLADCHLEAARLALAQHDLNQAREHWQQAADLIEQTGYHRRDGELAEIKEQLG